MKPQNMQLSSSSHQKPPLLLNATNSMIKRGSKSAYGIWYEEHVVITHKHGGRRSIAGIKESFKGNAARARLARAFRNKKVSREISCKNLKLTFNVKLYAPSASFILLIFQICPC